MEYQVCREYTVCRIPTAAVQKIKIYSPVKAFFHVRTFFLYADTFCTMNIVFPRQNVYCLCNKVRCIGKEWKKCEPELEFGSPMIEIKMTNHREYDFRLGEPILENDLTTLVFYVLPRFKTFTLKALSLPCIPSEHFYFERNTETAFELGFIATKRTMYAEVGNRMVPFCVCKNMFW